MDWLQWKAAVPGRQIVISQPMVPESAPSDWRVLGVEGAYDRYAAKFARNLAADGLGDSIIRLGWEANDTADPESTLGTDPSQYGDWAKYWARIVVAMRAVPGTDFRFDWTVNQYYRPIAFDRWYPGNSVVDIIGIDAYDSGINQKRLTSDERWQQLSNEPDGLNALAAFAAAHDKPMSIPEWGLTRVGPRGGAGDDPTYVEGLASFIDSHPVVYNSYFLKQVGNPVIPITAAPLSLAAYRSTLGLNRGVGP